MSGTLLGMFGLCCSSSVQYKVPEEIGGIGSAKTTLTPLSPWEAQYNTSLLVILVPKGVVFSFLF